MEEGKLKEQIGILFANQKLAVLSTQRGGQPHASLMAFAATDDLTSVLFATTRATRKYENLEIDARAVLLVDNRSNAEDDFHNSIVVNAVGRVLECRPEDREEWLHIYLSKHPYMKEFTASPSCALLKLVVDVYSVVTRFQNVVEVRMR